MTDLRINDTLNQLKQVNLCFSHNPNESCAQVITSVRSFRLTKKGTNALQQIFVSLLFYRCVQSSHLHEIYMTHTHIFRGVCVCLMQQAFA